MTRSANPARTKLFHYVALFCAAVIVYASLQPFTGWTIANHRFFAFLLDFSKRTTPADLLFNMAAYLPLGFALYAIWPSLWRVRARLVSALVVALALSVAVEALQTWLPTRVSSVYDTLANLIGALLGALVAAFVLARSWLVDTARRLREMLFIAGATGDLKILLLLVWLIVQINPGIPLFGATFHPGMDAAFEPVVIAVEIAQVAAALIGIGLFTDLAMRKRWLGGIALVLMITSAVLLKTLIAEWVLTPIAWESWLRPGHAIGVAAGSMLLTLLFWLPRRVKSVIAGIALLSSVMIPLLLPDLALRSAPLVQFSWHYGQLLNLNGLTRSIVMVWPFVATVLLLLRFGEESKRTKTLSAANQDV